MEMSFKTPNIVNPRTDIATLKLRITEHLVSKEVAPLKTSSGNFMNYSITTQHTIQKLVVLFVGNLVGATIKEIIFMKIWTKMNLNVIVIQRTAMKGQIF